MLVGYLVLTGRLPLVAELNPSQWTWVLVTGLFLAGYVGTWFAALSRANASVVTAVLVLGAPITATLDALAKGTVPQASAPRRLHPHFGRDCAGRAGNDSTVALAGTHHGEHVMVIATTPERATEQAGPIRFARYAYGPNRLGYCGPDDAAQLFGEATEGDDTGAIRRLAEQFEGAFPYLQLIAHSNGIADPLDERVVEAYWLGSTLLDNVTPQAFGQVPRHPFSAPAAQRRLALVGRQAERGRSADARLPCPRRLPAARSPALGID